MMLRSILGGVAGLVGLLALAASGEAGAADGPKTFWVFFGTYTNGKSKGIYRSELDLATGKLSAPVLVVETPSPSFLAIHPTGHFLYAVGEVNEFKGKKGGIVSAYALDGKTGALTLLNQQSSEGPGPCHVSVDPTGRTVMVANYGGGSVAAYAVGTDGKLSPATAFIQHKGKSADPARQEGPHGHSINADRTGKFAVAADLGLDQLLVYKLDAKSTLTPHDPPATMLKPGSGPRHFAFHPIAPYAFSINELDSTLTVLAWDAAKGTLTPLQTLSTLPNPVPGNSTAEVQVHPSGKFVYGSNRGHNSIAVFGFDAATGKLTAAGHQGAGIKTPRNFGIDPTGTFLLVANQDGDSVLVFRIDPKTGALTPTENKIEIGAPVCLKFLAK